MKKKLLLIMLGIVFFFSLVFVSSTLVYQDNFTGEVKSNWKIKHGSWAHNSTLDAYSTNYTTNDNKLQCDWYIPGDNYVEFKVIHVDPTTIFFDLLTRDTWVGFYQSGYAISYVKAYSDNFDLALILFSWSNGSRGVGLDYVEWSELDGFDNVTDFEGHTIGIETQGNIIKGYLDSTEILSINNTDYTNGTASVISNPWDGTFIFDNFKINTEYTHPSVSNFGYGTSSFSAQEDAQGTTNLTLETADVKIEFLEVIVNTNEQDYDGQIKIGERFVSVNTAELDSSFNNLAIITLKDVTCPMTPYFRDGVHTSAAQIISGGSPCDVSTTPSCTNIQCIGNTLTFTVSGFSSYAAPNYNNVTLILESDYTAPSYDNVTLILGIPVPPVVECTPTLNEDWVITDAQVCDAKEVTTGTGSINVTATGNLTLINAANVTTTKMYILGVGDKVFINSGCEIRIG